MTGEILPLLVTEQTKKEAPISQGLLVCFVYCLVPLYAYVVPGTGITHLSIYLFLLYFHRGLWKKIAPLYTHSGFAYRFDVLCNRNAKGLGGLIPPLSVQIESGLKVQMQVIQSGVSRSEGERIAPR